MPDLWSQLFRDYTNAGWGNRENILGIYQELTGKSRNTLRRKLKEMGFHSGRESGGGNGRCLDDEKIQKIAAFIRSSYSKKDRMPMDAATAMLVASHKGIIRAGEVSEGTVRSLMREHKVSKKQMLEPEPHVQMRSLHPNHVHQVDATPCVQYYLGDKGLGIRDADREMLYKPEKMRKIKQHLIRYLLVDHFSGAFYVHYYYAAGENWRSLFDFLFQQAWREKPEFIREKYPFAHVPLMLIWDAGSANQSNIIRRILDRLEVENITHIPGNPRAKGAVETHMWLWERKFESLLRMEPASNLEDLNAKALDMCAYLNARKKLTRTGMPRMALWSTIKAEQIRVLPPIGVIQALAHSRPDKRKVEGNLIIRFNGLSYDVRHIPGIARGEKVEVTVNPYRHPDVTVAYEGKKYAASAIQFLPGIQGGFRADAVVWGQEYRAHKDTPAVQAGKEMDKMQPAGLPFLGELHRELEPITFIDRSSRAAEIPLKADVEMRDIPRLKAARMIKEELGDQWRPWMAQKLKDEYGETVPELEIPGIIENLSGGGTITQALSQRGRE